MEKIITNNPKGYPEIRNIFPRYDGKFTYKKDIFNFCLNITHKITGKGYHPFWKGLFYDFEDQETPCVFFNTINLGNNLWKIYFETTVPRLGNVPKIFYDLAVKSLSKENCTEIIAISKCAYDLQIDYIKKNYPTYLEIIKSKMSLRLPLQKPLINNYRDKRLSKHKIVFTIIGSDFFRKGGKEVLHAFNDILPKNPHLHLNIISSLNYGDYATHTTKKDFDDAKDIIKRYPENIKHYSSLPNKEVLELLINSHVGLLPTWADSFGYSVLEAQAAGCPVITTNVRALPEINNNDIGWIINVPLKTDKNAMIDSPKERTEFSDLLQSNLRKILIEIIDKSKLIKQKGEKSLKKIIIEHEASIPPR